MSERARGRSGNRDIGTPPSEIGRSSTHTSGRTNITRRRVLDGRELSPHELERALLGRDQVRRSIHQSFARRSLAERVNGMNSSAGSRKKCRPNSGSRSRASAKARSLISEILAVSAS